mgnify:CR=1 FL=1
MTGPEMYRDPEGAGASRQPMPCEIDPHTRMGAVCLTVADLDRSCRFYEDVIGLRVVERDGAEASLGAGGEPLLVLRELPGARSMPHAAGLFHVALLLPEREDLAAWLAHAIRSRVALDGASDHFVSEALYLRDPDGHGIEIYADRPRDLWEGHVAATMTTSPLDLGGLLSLVDERPERYDAMPAGTVVGHVHLQVANIQATIEFYRDVLGFGLMAEIMGTAAFFGAGGYHHQLAGNTWNSAGRAPAPDDAAALQYLTIVLPTQEALGDLLARVDHHGVEREQDAGGVLVRDPSGNGLLLVVDDAARSV